MTTNFSHTNCNHPATSKARAICRKARAMNGGALDGVIITADTTITLSDVDLLATAPLPTTSIFTTSAHMGLSDAQRITRDLLAQHGLTGWGVTFDNQRRRAGACNYAKRMISLSRPLMAQRSYDDTMLTITHEIAHALTPGHNHGPVWAAKHIELGGNGKRCFDHADLEAPWVGTCPHGKVFSKYRAPRPGAVFRCKCVRGNKEGFSFVANTKEA